MPFIRYEDDCLAPAAKIVLNFKGENSILVYKQIKDILAEILRIKKKNIWERDYRVDITGEPKGFYARIYAKKNLDRRSYMMVEIIFQGKYSEVKNFGEMEVRVYAKLVTDYELKSAFQETKFYKRLIDFYHKSYYSSIREKHLEKCRDLLGKIVEGIKGVLKL